MLNFYERRNLKSHLYSKPVLILLSLLICFLLFKVYGIWRTERATVERRDEYAMERDLLKARHGELEKDITQLETDYGIEAEIREKFEVSRGGEKVLVIVEEEAGPEILPASTGGFWAGLKRFFGFGE